MGPAEAVPAGCYLRLLAAALLMAVVDARRGDPDAAEWLSCETARAWAELVGLERWPPAPEQWGSRSELQARARMLSTLPTE